MTTTAASMPGVVSKTVDVCGQPTHYLEAGSGPALVLIHGGGAGADSWGNWKDCLPLFARHSRVFAMDMIGFGKSAKPSQESYDYGQRQRNRHLAEFIEKLGLGPVSLIGNSMGGATALGVAIARPELVRKLVLMGSAGVAVSNPDPAPIKALAGYDFTLEGMRRIVAVLVGPHYRADDDMIRYRHDLTMQPGAREALQAIGQANRKEGLAYSEDQIRGVSVPTLVVGGKLDAIAVLARTYKFLELIPNSWGFVLPHCGHWVMVESPNEFAAITSAFLASDRFVGAGA